MMLAAPELVIAELVELLHEIEVASELQRRMLADRVMRGEEGSEFEARHGVSLKLSLLFLSGSLVSYPRHGFNATASGAAMHFPGPRKEARAVATRRIFLGGLAALAGASAARGAEAEALGDIVASFDRERSSRGVPSI